MKNKQFFRSGVDKLFDFAWRITFSFTKHRRQQYINHDFAKRELDPKAKVCLQHVEGDLQDNF